MKTAEDKLARLRSFNNWVHRSDPKLAEESRDLHPAGAPGAPSALESMELPGGPPEDAIGLESIVLRRTRPVLAIRDNTAVLNFLETADSDIWKERLTKAKPYLDAAIRAVGRVDVQGGRLDWVGTGWLVAENILVTNRHVAREFATRK